MRLKTLFIGNEPTYDVLRNKMYNRWDWQMLLPNIDSFWDALDGNMIDFDNTSIILVSDEFYSYALKLSGEDGENAMLDFLDLLFQLSQNALLFVVNYDSSNRQEISDNLHQYILDNAEDGMTEKKFYWIDAHRPQVDIDNGIREYLNSPYADPVLAETIADAENIPLREGDDDEYDEVDDYEDDDEDEEYTNNYHRDGMVICVTSSKGGVGKTSTTFGLSTWLYHSSEEAMKNQMLSAPLKICVVDLDVHDAQIGSVIGASQPTVLQIVLDDEGITQKTVKKNLHYRENLGAWFLLAPKLPKMSDTIQPGKYAAIIEVLKKMFDVIILDTSVDYTDDLFMQVAYPKANKIVFVTTLARPSLTGMHKWIYTTGLPPKSGGCSLDMDKVGVVINQGQKNVKMSVTNVIQLIDSGVAGLYNAIDKSISPKDYHRPKLIGAIPDIPNGQLMRLVNIQEYQLSLNIPKYESNIAKIARALMPDAISDNLPEVENVK